jgi:orotidine-5'-phosphate decarboxylase
MLLTGRPPLSPSFYQRLHTAFGQYGQLAIGIDPSSEQISDWNVPHNPSGLEHFGSSVLEACVGRVGIVKPQVAFYERFGSQGFRVLEKLCLSASEAGLIVIADAKRGDIGSTMSGYAEAWLGAEAPFMVDALTLSPFLGLETLQQTVDLAVSNNRGVFILAATSNPEAKTLQQATADTTTVSGLVASFARAQPESSLGSVGLVIGATTVVEDFGIDLASLERVPILAPGFGFQGAKLSEIAELFGARASDTIANVSRSVTSEGRDALVKNVESAKSEVARGLG